MSDEFTPAANLEATEVTRNRRATKEEMAERANVLLEFLTKGKADLFQIGAALGLTQPQVLTVVMKLQKTGQIRRSGKLNGRQLFRVSSGMPNEMEGQVSPPTQMSSIPSVDFVKSFTPGHSYRVSRVSLTEHQPQIELRDESGATRVLTLV